MAAQAGASVKAVEHDGAKDVGFAIGIVFILTVLFLPLPARNWVTLFQSPRRSCWHRSRVRRPTWSSHRRRTVLPLGAGHRRER